MNTAPPAIKPKTQLLTDNPTIVPNTVEICRIKRNKRHVNLKVGSTHSLAKFFISSEKNVLVRKKTRQKKYKKSSKLDLSITQRSNRLLLHSEVMRIVPLHTNCIYSPRNLFKRNDFPLPHFAYRPTVIGIDNDGSLSISARALLYKSYPNIFSLSSFVLSLPKI